MVMKKSKWNQWGPNALKSCVKKIMSYPSPSLAPNYDSFSKGKKIGAKQASFIANIRQTRFPNTAYLDS